MENKNLFWTNNFKILYNNENYLNFLPNKSMSRFEQLNAITRFCLYLIILCLLFYSLFRYNNLMLLCDYLDSGILI